MQWGSKNVCAKRWTCEYLCQINSANLPSTSHSQTHFAYPSHLDSGFCHLLRLSECLSVSRPVSVDFSNHFISAAIMATANPISSSCQSIATNSLANVAAAAATTTAGGSLRAGNGNGNTTHYVMGTGSLGRLKYHNKHKSLDASDEELEYSQVTIEHQNQTIHTCRDSFQPQFCSLFRKSNDICCLRVDNTLPFPHFHVVLLRCLTWLNNNFMLIWHTPKEFNIHNTHTRKQ